MKVITGIRLGKQSARARENTKSPPGDNHTASSLRRPHPRHAFLRDLVRPKLGKRSFGRVSASQKSVIELIVLALRIVRKPARFESQTPEQVRLLRKPFEMISFRLADIREGAMDDKITVERGRAALPFKMEEDSRAIRGKESFRQLHLDELSQFGPVDGDEQSLIRPHPSLRCGVATQGGRDRHQILARPGLPVRRDVIGPSGALPVLPWSTRSHGMNIRRTTEAPLSVEQTSERRN